MFRNPFVWIGILAVVVVGGPIGYQSCATRSQVVPPKPAGMWPYKPAPPGPVSLAVTPERLALNDHQVAWQILEVAYNLRDPETVQEAALELTVPEIGRIARMEVPVQPTAIVKFLVDPSPHDLRPLVQVRAVCPEGTTDWHAMGQAEPLPGGPPMPALRITPHTIRSSAFDTPGFSDGAGQRIGIRGSGLSAACNVEATVDGASIELMNVRFSGRESFTGLLMHRDISRRRVPARYAYLGLVIKRAGTHPARSTERLPFDEPWNR
jgi:hypothetical protein